MELKEEKKFESRYDGEAKETYDKIKNRPAFRYEAESDPAYRAYRDSYRREGELAMRSTQAEAADLTGGYGSSYAQRLGQQQYGEYLRKLSDVMPELYKDAYSRYLSEGDELNARLNAAGKLAEADYGRYKDEAQRADDKAEFEHKKQQDIYGNLADMISSTGYMPSAEELEKAGMSAQQAYALGYEFMRRNGLLPAGAAEPEHINYYNLSPVTPWDIGYREGMFPGREELKLKANQ